MLTIFQPLLQYDTRCLHDLSLTVGTVDFLKVLPLIGLAGADEGEESARSQYLLWVEGGGIVLLMDAVGNVN